MTAPDLFRIEEYFDGRVIAEGLLEDRFGNVRRKFSVTIDSHRAGEEFILDERFQFDDGESTHRVWHVRSSAPGQYEGRAGDVIGVAKGQAEGPELRWAYTMRVPMGKRVWAIDFDDRMFLREGGIMINIAEMRKWGITLGRITIAFRQCAS